MRQTDKKQPSQLQVYKKGYIYSYRVRLQRNQILLVIRFLRFGDLLRRLLSIFTRFGFRVTPTFRTKIEQLSKNKPQKISRKKKRKNARPRNESNRKMSAKLFSIRPPSGEIRSWVESPSTLDSGIIAILALLPLRPFHVYCILCPLVRPKSEPTRPRSWLIAVSRRSRAQRELQRALPRRRHRDRPTL